MSVHSLWFGRVCEGIQGCSNEKLRSTQFKIIEHDIEVCALILTLIIKIRLSSNTEPNKMIFIHQLCFCTMFEVRTHVFNEDSSFYHDFWSQMNTNSSQLIMLLIDRIDVNIKCWSRYVNYTYCTTTYVFIYRVWDEYICFSTFSMIINHFTIIFDLKRI